MAVRARSTRKDDRGTLPHDIESWEVRTRLDDEKVGKVKDVLLDEDGDARYLEVDLSDRHVLLPSGYASVDRENEVVWVPGMKRDAFRDVPTYEGDPGRISPDYEHDVASTYDRAYSTESYYEAPQYSTAWAGAGRGERADTTPVRIDTLDDVDVADYEHDPRGWTVIGGDGQALGKIEHLMGDTASMKVRYLTMRIDRSVLDEDRQVLIPAGHAALEPERKRVRVDALSRERIGGFPAWKGGAIEREHERGINEYLSSGYEGERRYRHPRYRQDRLYPRTGRERPT